MSKYDLMSAHIVTRYNRQVLKTDGKCGCFHCLKLFVSSEIEEWCPETDDGEEVTAICPYCGIDAIIPESAGFPLALNFLKTMNKRWF